MFGCYLVHVVSKCIVRSYYRTQYEGAFNNLKTLVVDFLDSGFTMRDHLVKLHLKIGPCSMTFVTI